MAINFDSFTEGTTSTIQSNDYVVGFDTAVPGGERKYTVSTLANAVSGIITPTLVETPAFTGTFKNKIINGNFDIWQRGTSITGSGGATYSSDRWFSYGSGTGFANVINTRQTFTTGQTEVPNNPKYFFRYNSNGTGVTYPSIAQRIEGVNTLAGNNITVSFWAKASTNIISSESLRLRQHFGTGGSPSSQVVTTIASNLNLTTSWQKFSFTTTLPSVFGKTIGSDNNDCLELIIPTGRDNINATVDIAQVQLEEGSVATPFEHRPIGTELALCQRYYEESLQFIMWQGTSYAGNWFAATGRWLVEKRTNPAVTLIDAVGQSGYFPTPTLHSSTKHGYYARSYASASGGPVSWTTRAKADAEL